MLFAITVTDKPGRNLLRLETRPIHLNYIKQHIDKIKFAGATLTEDGDMATGGLIIYEAETYADAEAFARDDPYAQAGLFDTVSVKPWIWAIGNPDQPFELPE